MKKIMTYWKNSKGITIVFVALMLVLLIMFLGMAVDLAVMRNLTMHEITLRGTAYQRGLQQGRAYSHLLRELLGKCPTWLGGKTPEEVNRIRDTMIRGLNSLWPEMVEELRGISRWFRNAF